MTKNCLKVLKELGKTNERPNRLDYGYSVSQISHICALPLDETQLACEQLESEGYAVGRELRLPGRSPFVESYRLTELGAHFKDVRKIRLKEYFLANWIALAALIIAVVSLLQSIGVISLMEKS